MWGCGRVCGCELGSVGVRVDMEQVHMSTMSGVMHMYVCVWVWVGGCVHLGLGVCMCGCEELEGIKCEMWREWECEEV